MRNLLFITVIFCALGQGLFGQSCDLFFANQEDIDNFPSQNPGCTFAGDVLIVDESVYNLDSLYVLDSVNYLYISTTNLTNLNGLSNIKFIDKLIFFRNPHLTDISGLHNINKLMDGLTIQENDSLISLNGLNNLDYVSNLYIKDNPMLSDIQALSSLKSVGTAGTLNVSGNDKLVDFSAFNSLQEIGIGGSFYSGWLIIENNNSVVDMGGFENLSSINNPFLEISISGNRSLKSLPKFNKLISTGPVTIRNDSLVSLAGLDSLRSVKGDLIIGANKTLNDFKGLEHLHYVELLKLDSLNVTSLDGLNNLDTIKYGLSIFGCGAMLDLDALKDTRIINNNSLGINIHDNASLTACAIDAVCKELINPIPGQVVIQNNGAGCNTPQEVILACGGIPVTVHLLVSETCGTITNPVAVENGIISLSGPNQNIWQPTNANGEAIFGYLDTSTFLLTLPQFPTDNWEVCKDTFQINPDTIAGAAQVFFLLKAINTCPQLHTELQLPSFFRGCFASSQIKVCNQNVGGSIAENTKVAVVIPTTMNVFSTTPPASNIVGDTLFFDTGDLQPFQSANVTIVVRTNCDTFLLGSTLCIEAMGFLDNPCPPSLETSDVRVYSECLSDTTVRFHLKNILGGATQNPHEYIIIEDEIVLMSNPFNLGPYGSMTVDVPANGATYRMEATQLEDGTLIATANEGCGGFTPGVVTAFWLNSHLSDYDYDCREVVLAYDPNQKTAIPKGVGDQHLLPANQPVTYTIDFQNTGTDTAFRVLLRDILSPNLDVTTFRPGASSNPYTWEIRGLDTLEVLFQPIMLPDSNVNEAASHGWFSFTINQQPDLADGTYIENTASIIFDYNPPIITNTTFHTIGELTVSLVETPWQQYAGLWRLLGNPAVTSATLVAANAIPGDKQFQLVNAAGKVMRAQTFSGQRLEIERGDLASGVYYFTITDQLGRIFGGKLMVR